MALAEINNACLKPTNSVLEYKATEVNPIIKGPPINKLAPYVFNISVEKRLKRRVILAVIRIDQIETINLDFGINPSEDSLPIILDGPYRPSGSKHKRKNMRKFNAGTKNKNTQKGLKPMLLNLFKQRTVPKYKNGSENPIKVI